MLLHPVMLHFARSAKCATVRQELTSSINCLVLSDVMRRCNEKRVVCLEGVTRIRDNSSGTSVTAFQNNATSRLPYKVNILCDMYIGSAESKDNTNRSV